MNNKIFFLILFLLVLLNGVSAADFPANGTDAEKQNWVLDPDNFNPEDKTQKDIFLQAYKDKKIDLRNAEHKKAVEKYLTNQRVISLDDRKMLNDFVKYYTLDKSVDLSKGQGISLKKENNNIFLVSSDGQKHNLDSFNSLELKKIFSRDDGTIELCFDDVCDNSIHLKDNTITKDPLERLVLGDGTILGLKEKFGKLSIEGNKMSCSSQTCAFSIGLMDFNLNSQGKFENLGANKFSVVDGKTKIGENLLSGSYEFTTDAKKTGIDFNKNINLRTFSREGQPILLNSFIQVNNEKYGLVEVGTISEKTISNVIACFDCRDFIKHV
ncbi:MAG: hypothetical protein AABX84_01530 [Nanoarchaeota archaeon]